jgi:fructokinase
MTRIVAVGEALWDLLPTGPQLGGAPCNFAYHAHALGADSVIVSRVGEDPRGHELLTTLVSLGLSTACMQADPLRPTGTVSVQLTDGHPSYIIHDAVAWDSIASDPHALRLCGSAAAICFGTLAQRTPASRDSIRECLRAAPPDALRIFDINLRQHYYSTALIEQSLTLANVLKLNDSELPVVAEALHLRGDMRACLDQLLDRFQLRAVACTRGDSGSLLRTPHEWSEHSGIAVTVADTVGAGDAFTAAFAIGLIAGRPLDQINDDANTLAAFVASSVGGTPDVPDEIIARCRL